MTWKIDTSHTLIQFSVRHMMITKVRGQFEKFDGEVTLDEFNPIETGVNIQIETASLNTRDARRDAHLRSADFFNSEAFPSMTFKSRHIEIMDPRHACLTGDLTIRDITHPVTLDVEYTGKAVSPYGATSVGFNASTQINRSDWNLVWNMALESGGVLVSDEIDINIELELVQQPETKPEAQAEAAA